MGFFKELAQNAIEGYVKSQLSSEQRAMLDKLQGPVKTKSGYSVQYIQDIAKKEFQCDYCGKVIKPRRQAFQTTIDNRNLKTFCCLDCLRRL